MISRTLVTVVIICLTSGGVFLWAGGSAQAPSVGTAEDEAAIRKVLENYVAGWREADTAKLAAVFDPDGRVMWLSGDPGAERLNTATFADILKRRRPQPEYGKEWHLESLDVLDGRLAMAKLYISRDAGHYVDYLALHKISGAWRIVNKTYVMR